MAGVYPSFLLSRTSAQQCVLTLLTLLLVLPCSALPLARMKDEPLSQNLVLTPKHNLVYTNGTMTLAVIKDGSVWTWGGNYKGQLARPSLRQGGGAIYGPGQVPGLTLVRAVALYGRTALALGADGQVWSWGGNAEGQLGYATPQPASAIPKQIPGLSEVVEVVAAPGTSLFLRKDGAVLGVGNNRGGILGEKGRGERLPLHKIEGIPPVRRIAAGGSIAAAIDAEGRLWTWGANGKLSGRANAISADDHASSGPYRSPAQRYAEIFNAPGIVSLPRKAVDVVVGVVDDAMIVLLEDGTLWSWGSARHGQIGRPVNGTGVVDPLPARIPGLSRVVQIAAGFQSFTALTADGSVVAWGYGVEEPIPPAPLSEPHSKAPVVIRQSLKVLQLTPGGWAYLDAQGNWWAWGNNRYGTRGTGTRREPCAGGGDCDKSYYLTPEKANWNYFSLPEEK
ncbi:MAG: repeat domain protein [Moraxellaceae bacterium]|jgi:alpha-tubulin suppressor-like RCC1 family protein|nr:repeat domain protein [Moraxellaceae bacterium]